MLTNSSIILIIAFILDLFIGDPHNFPHPIRLFGKIILFLESFFRKRDKNKFKLYGFYIVVISNLIVFSIYFFILYILIIINNKYIYTFISSFIFYQFLACRSLRVESMKVYKALKENNIEKARKMLSMIVGRDVESLNEEQIIKASIETVAENFSDGIIAPMFYYIIFFIYGVCIYKMVNTLDSMIGYKDEKYKDIGYFSAKIDDILNYIPARISAFLLLFSALFFTDMSIKNGYYIFKRDRYNHASPNSAQTESVVSGLFNIRLAGDAYYFGKLYKKPYIGDDIRSVKVEDIKRVNDLILFASIIFVIISFLILIL